MVDKLVDWMANSTDSSLVYCSVALMGSMRDMKWTEERVALWVPKRACDWVVSLVGWSGNCLAVGLGLSWV